jgi:LysM repeat protein
VHKNRWIVDSKRINKWALGLTLLWFHGSMMAPQAVLLGASAAALFRDRRLPMRRDIVNLSKWVGVVFVLALVILSGCTRAKSEPPAATSQELDTPAATEPSAEPTATSEVPEEGPIAATTTAWAIETATAEAEAAEETEAAPTQTAEPTTPAATDTPEPTEAPEPAETPEPTKPSTTTGAQTHVVQPGENLFRIALSYGLGYQTLATHNGIANPNLIYVGQELRIPAAGEPVTPPQPVDTEAGYHTVQPGENLFRIALKYGMLYTKLAEANGLNYPYTIYVGQRLAIP